MTRPPNTPASVSVVVLNHNYGRYIGEALVSAIGQEPGDYRLAEIVVIDDGSTDQSHTVYGRFPTVRVVRKGHEGFAATLTRAVRESSGDWIAPLDADDAFTSDKLRTLAPHLADPALLLIQHGEYVVDAVGRPFGEGTHPGGSTSTLVVRTDAAADLLPVTNELFFHVLADLGHGIRLPEPLTRYRVHEASMTDRRTPGVFSDYMAGVCDDLAVRLDQLSTSPPTWADAARLADLGIEHRRRGAKFRGDAQRQRNQARLSTSQERMCQVTEAVLFSESYYRQVLAEFGYTPFDLRQFDFGVAGLDADTLNARYLCHHDADQYLDAAPDRRVVTTGFGMSGLPHLATVSHILKMIELQQGGEQCQIVLGDLDAYNGKARPYAEVRELAERFREYALRLGFDQHAGTVRSQEGYLPALEAMYLLGRYVEQADFDAAEEDNHGYYANRGLVDATMTFRRALSLSLMAADFVALGQDHDAILVMLGVDEHRYVRFTEQARARLDEHVPLRSEFALTAAYTRMVSGFGGHPKFSKSIPGSALDVDTAPEAVIELLAAEPPIPEESSAYQLMCQMPRYNAATLLELHALCREAGPAWRHAVSDFADYVIDLIGRWPR